MVNARAFQLLDLCGRRLVHEGAGTQLPAAVAAPGTHCCVCHSQCVMPSSSHTSDVLQTEGLMLVSMLLTVSKNLAG